MDTKLVRPDLVPENLRISKIAIAEVSAVNSYNFKNFFKETFPDEDKLHTSLSNAFTNSFASQIPKVEIIKANKKMPEPFKSNLAFRGEASPQGKSYLRSIDADYVLIVRNIEVTSDAKNLFYVGAGDDNSITEDKISTAYMTMLIEIWETRRQVRSLAFAVRESKNPNKKTRDQLQIALKNTVSVAVDYIENLKTANRFSIYETYYN
jgi:hypothetical protein